MPHRFGQVPVSIDALLPSLGVLGVNHVSAPMPAPTTAGETKGQKTTLSTGPSTGESKKITLINEDGTVNQEAHKSVVYAQNTKWVKFYPPDEELDQYDYKNWTSFFPENKNLQITNPHWLREDWPTAKHDSLASARLKFFELLKGSLKELGSSKKRRLPDAPSAPGLDELRAARETSLNELQYILTSDADSDDRTRMKESLKSIAIMLQQGGVFGPNNRIKSTTSNLFELPPGWLIVYRFQQPAALKRRYDEDGKVGAYSNASYVGPSFSSWGSMGDNNSVYSSTLQDTPIQAWLVYLLYQHSGKTNDHKPYKAKKTKGADTDTQEPAQAHPSADPGACGDGTNEQTSLASAPQADSGANPGKDDECEKKAMWRDFWSDEMLLSTSRSARNPSEAFSPFE